MYIILYIYICVNLFPLNNIISKLKTYQKSFCFISIAGYHSLISGKCLGLCMSLHKR